ncbi:unnamed protein product [Sphagnum compactum]
MLVHQHEILKLHSTLFMIWSLPLAILQDSKGLEILSPCSSLWPLVLAIAQAGPGALDVAYYKLAEIHGSG